MLSLIMFQISIQYSRKAASKNALKDTHTAQRGNRRNRARCLNKLSFDTVAD